MTDQGCIALRALGTRFLIPVADAPLTLTGIDVAPSGLKRTLVAGRPQNLIVPTAILGFDN